MKNTIKSFSTGVALAIALFAAAPVSAMFKKPAKKNIVRSEEQQEIMNLLEYIADEVAKIRDSLNK